MLPFAQGHYRHKVAKGGRGSGKSWSIARILIGRATGQKARWLCCREIQRSIEYSSHKLIASQIHKMGLAHLWDIQATKIKGPRGSEFIFHGLRDLTADAVKSMEDLDGAWVEEAHTITEHSANILIPTVRNAGSEIWWSYNPDQEDDYVHKLALSGRPDVLTVNINWRDNRWFPAELEGERLQLKEISDDLYRHVWEGECRSLAGLLFKRIWFKRYQRAPTGLRIYMASDYAVTQDGGDWTEHGVFGMDASGNLYVLDWWSGQTDPETSIQAWLRLVKLWSPRISFDEAGVIHRALDGAINKRMRETQTFVGRETLPSASNKADRALGFAARASAGTIYLPETPWADRLLSQLTSFTGDDGRVDDMVDVCSLIGRALDMMANGSLPPEKPVAVKPFTEEWWSARDKNRSDTEAEGKRYLR